MIRTTNLTGLFNTIFWMLSKFGQWSLAAVVSGTLLTNALAPICEPPSRKEAVLVLGGARGTQWTPSLESGTWIHVFITSFLIQ